MANQHQAGADIAVAEMEAGAPRSASHATNNPDSLEARRAAEMSAYERERNAFVSSLTDKDMEEIERGQPITDSDESEDQSENDDSDEFPEDLDSLDWKDGEEESEVGEDGEAALNADDPDEGEYGSELDDEDDGEKLPRMRLKPANKRQADFLELVKKFPNTHPAKLAEIAGYDSVADAEGDKPTATAPESSGGRTTAEIDAEIEAAYQERRKAKIDYDSEKEVEMDDKIRHLETEKIYNRKFDEARAKAKAEFPAYRNESSDFSKRMGEIDAAWEEMGDPRFNDPEKCLILARLVKKEGLVSPGIEDQKRSQNLAPRRKRRAALAPASGNARSQAPGTGLVKKIGKISSVDDYEAMKRSLRLT